MQRLGFAIKLKPECMEDYKRVHANVWPDVLKKIRECNITNYSIFLHEPDYLMFGYYEYSGDNHGADMVKMAADEVTRRWWDLCKPMMEPLESRPEGEFWTSMDQIFFMER